MFNKRNQFSLGHRADFRTVQSSFRVRQKGGVPGPPPGFTQHQQMALLLGTMPQEPVDQRHKQWFRMMLPQCHALAARITLTVQKELQKLAVQAGVSAGQLRAAASASNGVASGALI